MEIKYIDNILVRTIEDNDYVQFNDWLKGNDYSSKDDIYESSIINGLSEEEIEINTSKLEEEFLDWCDENDVCGEV